MIQGWYYLLNGDLGRNKHLQVTDKKHLSERSSKNIPAVNQDVMWMEPCVVRYSCAIVSALLCELCMLVMLIFGACFCFVFRENFVQQIFYLEVFAPHTKQGYHRTGKIMKKNPCRERFWHFISQFLWYLCKTLMWKIQYNHVSNGCLNRGSHTDILPKSAMFQKSSKEICFVNIYIGSLFCWGGGGG